MSWLGLRHYGGAGTVFVGPSLQASIAARLTAADNTVDASATNIAQAAVAADATATLAANHQTNNEANLSCLP